MVINGNVVRAIRFIKPWRGKVGRDDKRDIDMTDGVREQLVRRGLAEWDDEQKPQPKQKSKQRESAAAAE